MFIIFSVAKMLGNHWLEYVIHMLLRTQKHQNDGACATAVWRILHANDMHPYHIQRLQLLNEEDFAARLASAHWYLEMRARDPRFPDTVLFIEEATFTREGMFNSHNSHVWSTENPHAARTCAAQVCGFP